MKLKLTKTDRTIGRFEKYLLKLLQEGVEVKQAVHLAYKKYPVMEIAQGEIEKLIYEAAELALGKPIQEELQFRLTQQPWANDGLVLSDRITKANVAVVASVVNILQHSLESSKTTYKVAKEIYEGYGKGGIIPVAEMANYIDDIVALAKEKKIFDKDFQKTIRKVKRQVDQLGSPALRASYKDILKAIQRGNEKALEKAVHVAAHEKTRYHAMRIARTETHRAYIEGQLLKDDSNEDVIAYQWRLSSRHPCFDICDVYANADLYGMGKGVFPVDKVPMLPAHPHCMCRLKRVIAGSIDNETPIMQVEEGGREYLDSLPPYKRQRILGKKGEQAYREGSPWTKHARGYTKKRLVSRLTLDKPNKIGYNKVIEYNGRKANVELDYKGRLIPNEVYKEGNVFSAKRIGKPNHVVKEIKKMNKEGYSQCNYTVYDDEGRLFALYHYGHHGYPKLHNVGTKEKPDYFHRHFAEWHEDGTVRMKRHEPMTESERGFNGDEY